MKLFMLSGHIFIFKPVSFQSIFLKPKQPQLSVLYFSILFLFVFKLPSSKFIDFFCLFIMSPRLHKFCSQTFGWLSIPNPLTCFYALLVCPPWCILFVRFTLSLLCDLLKISISSILLWYSSVIPYWTLFSDPVLTSLFHSAILHVFP